MKEAIELAKHALDIGIPIALLVAIIVLILIVHEPARAEKLKALLLQPTFRLFIEPRINDCQRDETRKR